MAEGEVSILRKHKNRLEEALAEVLQLDIVQKGKTTEGFYEFIQLQGYHSILASAVNIDGIARTALARSLVENAVKRLVAEDRATVDEFESALQDAVDEYFGQEIKRYTVLLPINIRRERFANRRSFNADGTRLYVWSWSHAERQLDIEAWRQECQAILAGSKAPFPHAFTPLAVRTEDRTTEAAFYPAEGSFELFRSLLNMSFDFGRYHMQSGKQSPLARILPAPVNGVFSADGTHMATFYEPLPPAEYKTPPLKDRQIEFAKAYLAHFARGTTSEVGRLIMNAITYYGRALDTPNWRNVFLSLWQVIEMVTFRESDRPKMDEVIKRAEVLLGSSIFLKHLLAVAQRTRNRLVHEGKFPGGQEGLENVCMLKMVVEQCILGLLSIQSRFRSWCELNRFYTYAKKMSKEREAIVKTIHEIDKWEGNSA